VRGWRKGSIVSYQKQLQAYQSNSIQSASPLQLVVMLYDGAIRFIKQGQAAMEARDLYAQNTSLQRAQKIVAELMSCLDMDQGGEVANNLFALYTYAYNQLVEGNMTDDPRCLAQSLQVLEGLRASWVELEKQTRAGAQGGNDVQGIQQAA